MPSPASRPEPMARACLAVVVVLAPAMALALALAPSPAAGQEGWDGERVLGLVERARERRQAPVLDEELLSYRADVAGHIYFFVDRPGEPEPILLRADQVALHLYWSHPDQVKQVIRGMRHEEQFPIRDFRYYLDRYTVIHDGFGDEIRVGEGRDVRNVPHPLAPMADQVYQYRLTDSTTIRLPGAESPIRVYEIQVRPRSLDAPAIVGSLFVERARADLVRMAFTFTRAAYLDPRNERVEIMLENALWEGRYWLPREQRLLVRRELPQFDFGVGTVIRAALRVTDYDLNVDLPSGFFIGPSVVAVAGPAGLGAYDFDSGLYDGFEAVGLAPGQEPATLGEVDIDAIAGRVLREQYLRGVPRVRLYVPTGSHLLRYGRTEGLATGAGISLGAGRGQLGLYGGYAWGSGDALAQIDWRPVGTGTGPRPFGELFLNRPIDLGLRPAAAGVISTAAAAFGSDYRDVYPATGLTAGVRSGAMGGGTVWVGVTGDLHRTPTQAETTPPLDDEGSFRPVAVAEEGQRLFLTARYERRAPWGPLATTLRPAVEVGWASFEDDGSFARLRLGLETGWTAAGLDAGVDLRATAAAALGVTPPQHLWYLGGRNTLPGHPFHGYVGDRAAVVDVEGWRDVVPRLIQLRLIGVVGWSAVRGDPPIPDWRPGLQSWEPAATDGIRGSVGAGIGLLHGILRLDYALRTDSWDGAFILSVDPRLWGFL